MSVEAVPWIARAGSPWRDRPDVFGAWSGAVRRLSSRSAAGVWPRVFAATADDGGFESLIVGSTIMRAHPHAAAAGKGLAIRLPAAPAAA